MCRPTFNIKKTAFNLLPTLGGLTFHLKVKCHLINVTLILGKRGQKVVFKLILVKQHLCLPPAGHPEPRRPRSSGEGLERRLPSGG